MMTGVLGAGLPLPSTAMPAESGESADPAGGQSFLAALAAAVAAPVLPPEPEPVGLGERFVSGARDAAGSTARGMAPH